MTARVGRLALTLAVVLALGVAASGGTPMTEHERLAPCPDSPNCVSSLSEDPAHRVEPLRVAGPPDAARARLREVLREPPRVRIVTDEPGYLHAEFTSAVFGFVDDVEFRFDGDVIQVRSASRIGYYDFGANRRRIETIRERLQE